VRAGQVWGRRVDELDRRIGDRGNRAHVADHRVAVGRQQQDQAADFESAPRSIGREHIVGRADRPGGLEAAAIGLEGGIPIPRAVSDQGVLHLAARVALLDDVEADHRPRLVAQAAQLVDAEPAGQDV
jgi:hypothetical protein